MSKFIRYDDCYSKVSTSSTKSTRTYKYYDEDDEIMDKTKTSDYGSRAYDYLKSDSQSQHLKSSSSSRVPPSSSSSTYNYNKYESRSHYDKDRDSPGRTVASGSATTSKRDQNTDDNTTKDSKLYVRSYGDWDELVSTTSNEPKTYFYNRVTKKSQWNKPEEVIEMEESRSSKYYDKYDDRYRDDHRYRDDDRYRSEKYRSDDKYRLDDRRYDDGDDDKYRSESRYKYERRYRDDRSKDDRRSSHYRDDDDNKSDYYHDSRRDKYDDRYDETDKSSMKSGRRREEYDYDDSYRSRKYQESRYSSPGRSETSQKRKYTYYTSSSNDKKDKSNHDPYTQSSYRSSRARSRSNHRDYNYDHDDEYERTRDDGVNGDDEDKHNTKRRSHSVQIKPNNNNNNHRNDSIAGSFSASTPSDSDSKSDDPLGDDRSKIRRRDEFDLRQKLNESKRGTSNHNESMDNGGTTSNDTSNPVVSMDTKEKVEIQSPQKRRRSLTPLIELKRPRTTSDGNDTNKTSSSTPISKKSSPENQKSFNGISLSPSQVSTSNLREIIDHFSGAPEMSELQKMNEEDALKTIHQMLRLLKQSSGGHLKQQLSKQSESKSCTNSPLVKVTSLNSVQGSNSKLNSLNNKSRPGEKTKSIYDNLKKQSNDIKDDLNRLLPSTASAVPSPPSESSDSCSRSPRSDLVSRPSRNLLAGSTSSSVNCSSSKSITSGHVLPSITPSLVACFKEDLISHVQGWQADISERQAKKYADEAHNLGSLNCTRVSAELKMARSLVRLTEIQATLQEQRILFVRQQIKDVEEWKKVQPGNIISTAPSSPTTISGTIPSSSALASTAASHLHHPPPSTLTNCIVTVKEDKVSAATGTPSTVNHNSNNSSTSSLITNHT